MTDEVGYRPLFRWREAVCSEDGPPPTTRHVLLTLSLHMNGRGERCWPSTRKLAEETGRSRRTVEEHLRQADNLGWIDRSQPERRADGTIRRTHYTATIPGEPVSPGPGEGASPSPGETDAQPGETASIDQGQEFPHRSSTEQQDDNSRTTTNTGPGERASPGPGEGASPGLALQTLADIDAEQDQGKVTQALVAAWIEVQPERPSGSEIGKQGAVAKRLAEKHEPRRLAIALYGMDRVYPFSDGEPWDLFDLERKFSKACNAALSGGSDGTSKAERKKRKLYDTLTQETR